MNSGGPISIFRGILRRAGARRWKRLSLRLFAHPIAPALDLINAAEAELRGTAGTLEARFLESGDALENLSRSSQSLIENSGELVRMATGRREAEQIIGDTMAVLAEPLEFLHGYTGQLGIHTDSLGQGSSLLGRLLDFESDLQAAVAPLRATRTMFRVEASRLPEAEQAAFLALSDQIEVLHNQVRDSFGVEFAKLAETRAGMNTLVSQLTGESAAQREILDREKARIAEELEKLTRQIDLNSQGEVQLTARGRVVAGAVSRVVVTLQNQDIVAQRMAHIFEGIEQVRTLAGEFDQTQSDSSLAHLGALVDIQSGQLSSTLDHLTETAEASGSATAEIFSTIDAMDHECVFLQEFSQVTAAANGTIQVLLDIVEEIRGMVSSAVRIAMDSLEQIQPVNSLTTQLSDCVEHLSHQMNLVALNAQIQAVRTGAGTGLEVLAAHTAMVATETSRLGGAIRENFEQLRSFLKTEMTALTELCDRGRVQQTYLELTGGIHEGKLHAIRDETLGRLHQLVEDAIAVRTNAQRMADAAMLSASEAEGFRKMEEALSNMKQTLSEALSTLPEDSVRLEIEHAGYTMASERENHFNVVGGAADVTVEDSQVELF
jgi:hypothetical protein